MLSYAVRLVVAFLLIVAYLIARRCYYGDLRRRSPPPPQQQRRQTVSSNSEAQARPQPLSRENKRGVASTTFTSKSSSLSCAICLEDYKSGDECRRFVMCNHRYHKACIDLWLARANHCPMCRGSVRGASVRAPDNLDQIV